MKMIVSMLLFSGSLLLGQMPSVSTMGTGADLVHQCQSYDRVSTTTKPKPLMRLHTEWVIALA